MRWKSYKMAEMLVETNFVWLVQRFLPSEFGYDVENNVHGVGPVKSIFEAKVRVRRAVEAEGIPYTYVWSYYFNGFCLPSLAQHGASAPPRDKVIIKGDGNPKGNSFTLYIFFGLNIF